MILKINRDDIIEGLQKSANIIPSKTGAAFLRTIWLKGEDTSLNIMSTDSNLEFCGSYPCTIEEPGLAGVQGRAFYELVKKLPSGELTIKTTDKQILSVQQDKRKYQLPVNDEEWFQKFSEFPDKETVFWSGDFLHELIERISYCISDEDAMEAIACMHFVPSDAEDKHIEACGLNGHQFAMMSFLNDDIFTLLPNDGILIQKKYLSELKKWLTSDEIELNISEKRLFLRTTDQTETFSLPLSYYNYPDYHSFLSRLSEENISRLVVDRLDLMAALERILIFNSESNRCAHFILHSDQLVLYSQGQETGKATESIQAQYNGDLEQLAFPTKNLLEILSHFDSKEVEFILTGKEAPSGITGSEDPDYQSILMPMIIQEQLL